LQSKLQVNRDEMSGPLKRFSSFIRDIPTSEKDNLHKATRDFQLEMVFDDLPMSFVELIGWLACLFAQRASRQEDASKPESDFFSEPDDPAIQNRGRFKRRWAQVCALCRLVIDLAAHLHPRHLNAESGLRVKYSTLYGVALGRPIF
jgi:hypothetical protein